MTKIDMMNSRLLFLIGTIHWFLFASGHHLIVDIDFVLGMHSPLGPEVLPDGDLVRETLISNTWDFGWLGVVGTIMFAFAARSIAREEPIGETLT